ncbi:MAG: MFS transporter [Anaerolineae bacterium]|nr:MFS transporter [Anaerolineae bacterium]
MDKTNKLATVYEWFSSGQGNISKLAIAYFFSNLYFYLPVGTIYLQSRGLNYVQINSLWGIIVGAMFLTEVPTGMLADRWGRKRSINVALALQLLGEVMYIFADSYLLFVLTSVVAGVGFAFASGCLEALTYDSLKALDRQEESLPGAMSKAMGSISAAQRAANLIAFPLGGLLIGELTQARFVIGIIATACAVGVGWLVSLTLKETSIGMPAHENSLVLLVDGLKLLRDNRAFRRLALLALTTIPFRDYLGMYQPRLIEVGLLPVGLGVVQSAAAGLSIVGARYAYWIEQRLGSRASLLLVTSLPGLLYLVAAAAVHPIFSPGAFCLLSGSMSLKDPLFSAHLNRHIASRSRATVLSMISMVSGLYVALMGLLIGRIGDLSLTWAFVFMGGVVLLGSLVLRGE